jgi:hypothetical protein
VSPDRHLPRWARIAGWVLCLVSYALAGLVAIGDTFVPSVTITGTLPDAQVVVGAWALGAASVCGMLAVGLHRWRVEWVSASAASFLLLARSVPVWASLGDNPNHLSAAAMMTLGALCIGKRALDLWVFFYNTTIVARHHRARRQAIRTTGALS